jgi:hypothetical protein
MKTENQNSFIEVLGESFYQEKAFSFPFQIQLKIVQKVEDTFNLRESLSKLENLVIEILDQHKSELLEVANGGIEFENSEYNRIKQRIISRKYLCSADTYKTIASILEKVMDITTTKDESITLNPKQPKFVAETKDIDNARAQAIASAREHAEFLAQQAKSQLGSVISIRQLASKSRSSGAFSDTDWRGDSDRFENYHVGGTVEGSAGSVSSDLSDPMRTIFLRYLIQFAIEAEA